MTATEEASSSDVVAGEGISDPATAPPVTWHTVMLGTMLILILLMVAALVKKTVVPLLDAVDHQSIPAFITIAIVGLSSAAIPATFNLSNGAAGYLLGFWWGACCVLPSCLLSMIVVFSAIRSCSVWRDAARSFVERRLDTSWTRRSSLKQVVSMSLLPGVPFAVHTLFWASTTTIPLKRFILGRVIVILPWQV